MFSLKQWNFEAYKAAVSEIEDPVDRLDELNATLNFADAEVIQTFDESTSLLEERFEILKAWVDQEIESLKSENSYLIKEREKKAWQGHVRLPFPVVWDRDSYSKIEPEVRKTGKKKEWIDWLLKNLNEGKIDNWTYEQWIINAVGSEDYYLKFAKYDYELTCPSYFVLSLKDNFIDFLFNLQKVLSLKEDQKSKTIRGIRRVPFQREINQLEKIIIDTMKSRLSSKKSLNWHKVLHDLKNNTEKNQTIIISEFPVSDESMKEGISLYVEGFNEPIHRMQISTFKKKLSLLRKLPLLQ